MTPPQMWTSIADEVSRPSDTIDARKRRERNGIVAP